MARSASLTPNYSRLQVCTTQQSRTIENIVEHNLAYIPPTTPWDTAIAAAQPFTPHLSRTPIQTGVSEESLMVLGSTYYLTEPVMAGLFYR